jgi:addiction module HigA family antidote
VSRGFVIAGLDPAIHATGMAAWTTGSRLVVTNVVGFLHEEKYRRTPGRLLKRELSARELSTNRLALDIGVPSGRITDILNGRRSITADTAVRFGRYFGNSAQFWLDLQGQYDIAVVERESGAEIIRRVRPTDAA